MYNYENKIKKNNVGFARIESRNGQCKITIHIKALSVENNTMKAYVFHRKNGHMECIYLGNIVVKNTIGDFRILTETDNLMDSGYSLEDIGGVIVYDNPDKFFGTEWDDIPIQMDMLRLSSCKKEEPAFKMEQEILKAAELHELTEVQEYKEEQILSKTDPPKIEEPKKEIIQAEEREIEQKNKDEIMEEKEGVQEDLEQIQLPNFDENKKDIEKDFAIEQQIEENDKEIVSIQPDNAELINNIQEEVREERSPAHNKRIQLKQNFNYHIVPNNFAISAEPLLQENEEQEQREERKQSNEEIIFSKYPSMYPFEDDEMIECIRIEPQDIGILPMETWVLANNSFLLHGYYSYRHLILGKKRAMGGYQYILGVPGIYQNRERFMARMFGFYQFKPVKNSKTLTGEFGYWYMPIILD